MQAVFCLALLAAVAVIGTRGETCTVPYIDTCGHEHCSDSAGTSSTLTCVPATVQPNGHNGICTCVVSSTSGAHICYENAGCHIHCPDHFHPTDPPHTHGHGGHGGHGHHTYTHQECVNGRCHCRH